jgi:hypothetical protein
MRKKKKKKERKENKGYTFHCTDRNEVSSGHDSLPKGESKLYYFPNPTALE